MSYVLVTIATNGVIHAWGKGKEGQPFDTQGEARKLITAFKKQNPYYLDPDDIRYCILKVLGDDPNWEEGQHV